MARWIELPGEGSFVEGVGGVPSGYWDTSDGVPVGVYGGGTSRGGGTSFGLPLDYSPVANPGRGNSGIYNTRGRNADPLGGMAPYYEGLELEYGLQRGSLAQMAFVESSGNPNKKQGSYEGLFQMGPDEQKMFGITDPYNPFQSARGGARYAKQNLAGLPATNRTPFDAYMAHQQGLRGYNILLGFNEATPIGNLPVDRQNKILSQKLKGIDQYSTLGDWLDIYRKRFETSPSGQPWGDWAGYNGVPFMGFGGSNDPGTFYGGGVNNSIFNSINPMLPWSGGGTPQPAPPGSQTASLEFTVGGGSGGGGGGGGGGGSGGGGGGTYSPEELGRIAQAYSAQFGQNIIGYDGNMNPIYGTGPSLHGGGGFGGGGPMTLPEGTSGGSGIGTSLFYPYSGSAQASANLTRNTTNSANSALAAFGQANALAAAQNAQATAQIAAQQQAQQAGHSYYNPQYNQQQAFDDNLARMWN